MSLKKHLIEIRTAAGDWRPAGSVRLQLGAPALPWRWPGADSPFIHTGVVSVEKFRGRRRYRARHDGAGGEQTDDTTARRAIRTVCIWMAGGC